MSDVTLREYVEAKIDCLSERMNASSVVSEKALEKAHSATEKRFDSVNEFRAALSDQANNMVTRNEYNVRHEALMERTETNSQRLAMIEAKLLGHREGTAGIGTIIVGVLIGINSLASLAAVAFSVLHQ